MDRKILVFGAIAALVAAGIWAAMAVGGGGPDGLPDAPGAVEVGEPAAPDLPDVPDLAERIEVPPLRVVEPPYPASEARDGASCGGAAGLQLRVAAADGGPCRLLPRL